MKYTVLDIFKIAGVPEPEAKAGKFSASIGGVNANAPDKVINVGAGKVDVVVAGETYEADIPAEQSEEHAENVRLAKEAKGRKATEAREAKGKGDTAPPEE